MVGLAHAELIGGAGAEGKATSGKGGSLDAQLEIGNGAVERVVLGAVGIGVDPADEVLLRGRNAAADHDVLARQSELAGARLGHDRGGADLTKAAQPVLLAVE